MFGSRLAYYRKSNCANVSGHAGTGAGGGGGGLSRTTNLPVHRWFWCQNRGCDCSSLNDGATLPVRTATNSSSSTIENSNGKRLIEQSNAGSSNYRGPAVECRIRW